MVKQNRKKGLLMRLLLFLAVLICMWLLLRSCEPKVDLVTENQQRLIVRADMQEKEGLVEEALANYKAANDLIESPTVTERINDLEERFQRQRDSMAWITAYRKHTELSYQTYLHDFIEGQYALQARDSLDILNHPRSEEEAPEVKTRRDQAAAEQSLAKQSAEEEQLNAVLDEMESNMIQVSGGTFMMGCEDYYRPPRWEDNKPHEFGADRYGPCGQDENPAHEVTLSDFAISKYEVTQEQWMAIMGENPSKYFRCAKCPVEQVTWQDIQDFIQKLNLQSGKMYRLPTEAEWEYAARGGKKSQGYRYAGSDDRLAVAWCLKNSEGSPHPVGQKLPNELGLYDMFGNVLEYCQDWYYPYYYRKSPEIDPKGPNRGTQHVIRGGSWGGSCDFCRFTERFGNYTYEGKKLPNIGFRLVLEEL